MAVSLELIRSVKQLERLSIIAIGSIVGHEITHGFDELRRHIDKDGRRITSWSNETIDMFNKRSECIVEQYNNYTVAQLNLQINGKRTREENIADNDGLKKAVEVRFTL